MPIIMVVMEKDGQKRWNVVQIEDVIFILQLDVEARRYARARPSPATSSDQGPGFEIERGRADRDFRSSSKADPGLIGLDDWGRVHNCRRAGSGDSRLSD